MRTNFTRSGSTEQDDTLPSLDVARSRLANYRKLTSLLTPEQFQAARDLVDADVPEADGEPLFVSPELRSSGPKP